MQEIKEVCVCVCAGRRGGGSRSLCPGEVITCVVALKDRGGGVGGREGGRGPNTSLLLGDVFT